MTNVQWEAAKLKAKADRDAWKHAYPFNTHNHKELI